MTISVENLGVLRKADFELGDMTIICGANNTSKTYATYALYGFLKYWHDGFNAKLLSECEIKELFDNGTAQIVLDSFYDEAPSILSRACEIYCHNLPMVFGAPSSNFSSTGFYVSLNKSSINFYDVEKKIPFNDANNHLLATVYKESKSNFVGIRIHAKVNELDAIVREWIIDGVNKAVLEIIFDSVFPVPFIASIERTGAATFQRELDITRNRLIEKANDRESDINFASLLNTLKGNRRYALPVRDDVDFNRGLYDVIKYDSVISRDYPEIIKTFDTLLGGEYKVQKEGVHFAPKKSKTRLSMNESASSVRSLLNLGIYLRHIAEHGDILMIDEPELNLHPINQRSMARLLAMLVNMGIKVFVSTHSDYIIREINTLIMLGNCNTEKPELAETIKTKYGYYDNEILNAGQLKVYIAKRDSIAIDGKPRKQQHNTLVRVAVDEHGAGISSFDETIDLMNEIQDEIMYGGA